MSSGLVQPTVKGVVICDHNCNTVAAKFYSPDLEDKGARAALIRALVPRMSATARSETDILMYENNIVLFRGGPDTLFFVVGAATENEILISAVLDGFVDCLAALLRGQIDRRTLLDNLALVLLTIDEIIDGGLIVETDASAITSRVLMRNGDDAMPAGEVPLSELTISQALSTARHQIMKSMAQQNFN